MKKTLMVAAATIAFMAASPAKTAQWWWGRDWARADDVSCVRFPPDTSPAREYEKLTGMGMRPKLVDRGDAVFVIRSIDPSTRYERYEFFRSREACEREDESRFREQKLLDKYR
jgi:hypothetical protein